MLLQQAIPSVQVRNLLEEVKGLAISANQRGNAVREPYYHVDSFKVDRIFRLSTAFDELIDHPSYFGRIVSLMGTHIQIMGAEFFVRGPANTAITAFHTDLGPGLQRFMGDNINPFLSIKVQIFLTDVSQHNSGNFALMRGSHRWMVETKDPLCYISKVNRNIGPHGELPDKSYQVCARPGDVLLFPHSLWHAVAPNRTENTRLSVTLRYGQTCLRPLDRFDPILAEPSRKLTKRQRRLLGDFGEGDSNPYRPSDQDNIILYGQDSRHSAEVD